jgi:dienelactone hydrolase
LFAADLRVALDVCVDVRLGDGRISVDPHRLGVVGHSFGGGCAVLAAAEDERVRAVVTLAAAESYPPATDAARHATMPGLHLAAGHDRVAPPVGHAEAIAQAWAGPVQLRTLRKATHLGFTEGKHWSDLLLDGRRQHFVHRLTKALTTAFLLRVLTGTRQYDALIEQDVHGSTVDYLRTSSTPPGQLLT